MQGLPIVAIMTDAAQLQILDLTEEYQNLLNLDKNENFEI